MSYKLHDICDIAQYFIVLLIDIILQQIAWTFLRSMLQCQYNEDINIIMVNFHSQFHSDFISITSPKYDDIIT